MLIFLTIYVLWSCRYSIIITIKDVLSFTIKLIFYPLFVILRCLSFTLETNSKVTLCINFDARFSQKLVWIANNNFVSKVNKGKVTL